MAGKASGSPKLPENSVANTVKNVQPNSGRNIGPTSDKNGKTIQGNKVPRKSL